MQKKDHRDFVRQACAGQTAEMPLARIKSLPAMRIEFRFNYSAKFAAAFPAFLICCKYAKLCAGISVTPS